MQTDDVASAQQHIELDRFDRHIINPVNMPLETEHMAAKGIAQLRNLQPDGAAGEGRLLSKRTSASLTFWIKLASVNPRVSQMNRR
jgi:hypothetical protein